MSVTTLYWLCYVGKLLFKHGKPKTYFPLYWLTLNYWILIGSTLG